MSEELKALPCPWCAIEPSVVPWHGGPPSKHAVCCENDDCEAAPMVTGKTRALAIAAWNRRTPSPAPAPEFVALVEQIKKHRKNQGGYWDDEKTDAAIAAAERALKNNDSPTSGALDT